MTISPEDGGSGRSRHPPPLSPPPPLTLRGRTHPPPRADSSSRYLGAGDGGAAPGHPRSSTRRARSGISAQTFPPCPHPSISYLSPSPSHPSPVPVSVPVPIPSRSFPCPPSYPIPSHERVHPDPHLPPCHHAMPCHAVPLGLSIPGTGGQQRHHTPSLVPSTVPGYRGDAGFGGVLSPTPLSSGGLWPLQSPSPVFSPDEFQSTPSPHPPAGTKAKAFAPFSGTRGGCGEGGCGRIWGGFGGIWDIFKTNTFTKEDLKV